MDNRWNVLGPIVGLGLILNLTGCPNPNTYGTPRTTPPGRVSHSIAVEAIGAHGGGGSIDLPTGPTYTLRVGATDNFDVGFRVANMSTLGADAKFNFLKGAFDIAIDPGVQAFYYSVGTSSSDGTSAKTSLSGAYLHLPLLFGANLSESVTLVPTIGIMYGIASSSSTVSSPDENESVKASGNTGLIGRLGLGANFRLGQSFAMQPEVTVMKSFKQGAEGVLYLAGLGFNFGALPDFSDLK
jgi:hypothetical protein